MTDLDVLVIGRNCLDHIVVVDRFPEEDRKAPLNFKTMEGGGQGGTSACCISKLGGKVAYIGKLGDDPEGEFCLQRLKDFGVDTSSVQVITGGKTPLAYVFVTRLSGKRTIIYERNFLPKLKIDDLLPALKYRPKILQLDPEVTYLAKTLKTRFSDAVQIVYDCERWRSGMAEMMAAADFFIPSAEFLDSDQLGFSGLSFVEKLVQLKKKINGDLIITRGGRGAYYFIGDDPYRVPAPKIAVKDTTGAGDNFHAAFALATARKFDVTEAVKFSVAVASLSCREYGGRAGIPEMDLAIQVAESLKAEKL